MINIDAIDGHIHSSTSTSLDIHISISINEDKDIAFKDATNLLEFIKQSVQDTVEDYAGDGQEVE